MFETVAKGEALEAATASQSGASPGTGEALASQVSIKHLKTTKITQKTIRKTV